MTRGVEPGSPSLPGRPTRRADARRNYDRIVTAARKRFARQGPDASLEAIAEDAGVGSATLHRHFPHRYALMEAAFWSQIEDLSAQGRALADHDEPGRALRDWLRALVDLAAERGLAAALMAGNRGPTEGLFEAAHTALRDGAAPLLRRAQEADTIRGDVELDDLLQAANAVAMAVAGEDPETRPGRADRLFDLLIHGIELHPRSGP